MYWANFLHIYQPPKQEKEIIDKVLKESYDKILLVLENNPKIKISLNINGSLTEQLGRLGYNSFLKRLSKLAEQGQVEFSGSACYHPILPLLPREEIKRQIKLNEEINKKYFGRAWQPKGFFLPEMAVNEKVLRIVKEMGYEYVVLDEIGFNGKLNRVDFKKRYYTKDGLVVVFRNRKISLLFFSSWTDNKQKIFYQLENSLKSQDFLVTAFDGENLGHHQKHLIQVWEDVLKSKKIKAINYSEYISQLSKKEKVAPLDCSWATEEKDMEENIPYPLWNHPNNKIHQVQWEIFNFFIKKINFLNNLPNYQKVRKLLDQALHSDQFWWASRNPWWSKTMIKKGLDYFISIFKQIKGNLSLEEQQKIEQLFNQVLKEIQK